MNCNAWREQASDYVEGALPPAQADALRRHAAGCASCRADEAALRGLCRELNVLAPAEPPLFFRENLRAVIEAGNGSVTRPLAGAYWRTLLPHLGRVAAGTFVASGVAAAVLWAVLVPGGLASPTRSSNRTASVVASVSLPGLLPGASASSEAEVSSGDEPARLRIGRVLTVLPDEGPVYDFALWLENAEKGTARFQLANDDRRVAYRFNLGAGAVQTLRVPLAAASARGTIDLTVFWTADGASHTRALFVPVSHGDRAPERRQSFGLPPLPLGEAAREITARYGTPVTLDDAAASAAAPPVTLSARGQTAAQALRAGLAGRGLRVSVSGAGVLVAPSTPGLP